MLVCSLGSSSKGNAFLIEHEGLSILVDAGFAVRELANRLQTVGVEPQSVSAIFVTHEHIDHIGGVRRFAERFGACVFSSPAIRDCVLGDSDVDWRPLAAGEPVEFEGFCVHPFSVPHDAADPFGLRIEVGGASIVVCTDLGMPTRLVEYHLARADVWIIEANHDPAMLRDGPYPWQLKQRIASAYGHLSNLAAADLIGRVAHDGLVRLMLAHLSETNNTPELARQTVAEALNGRPLEPVVARPDGPVELLRR